MFVKHKSSVIISITRTVIIFELETKFVLRYGLHQSQIFGRHVIGNNCLASHLSIETICCLTLIKTNGKRR